MGPPGLDLASHGYTSSVIDGATVTRALDRVQRGVDRGADAARVYLASPEGRRLRRRVAQVVIVAAPMVARSRLVRATWIGRVAGVAGAAGLAVKLAEALRDWDPAPDAR